jgi:hypothetical protein
MQDVKVRKDYCAEIVVISCILVVERECSISCIADSVIVVRHPQLATDSEVVKRCTYNCSKWPIGFLRNGDIVPHVVEHYERGNAIAAYAFSL